MEEETAIDNAICLRPLYYVIISQNTALKKVDQSL